MKKIILVLLVVSAPCFAQPFKLSGHVEFGASPASSFLGTVDGQWQENRRNDLIAYGEFAGRLYGWNTVFIGGNVRTWMMIPNGENGYTMTPFFVDYLAEAGVKIGDFEFGIRHYCYHPINTAHGERSPVLQVNGSHEELYIRYSF